MATRLERLSEFSQGEPPAGEAVELLCEDGSGTYLIPSLCRWVDGNWVTAERSTIITAKVVGWRVTRGYAPELRPNNRQTLSGLRYGRMIGIHDRPPLYWKIVAPGVW